MDKLAKVFHNPWSLYVFASGFGLTDWIPDEPHLKAMYRGTVGTKLDLENPKTYNEKLQWLKIHDRNPLYNVLVDKYQVKPWVADRIGEEHVTKTYAMWEKLKISISLIFPTGSSSRRIMIAEALPSVATEAPLTSMLRKRNWRSTLRPITSGVPESGHIRMSSHAFSLRSILSLLRERAI